MWPKQLDTPYTRRSVVRHQMWSSLAGGCHAMPWLPRLRGGFPPGEATTCWEWHKSCLSCWQNDLRYATHDICPTVVKWGTRVLLCHFCPRQKVELCKQAPLVACKADAAHRHTQSGCTKLPSHSGHTGLGKGHEQRLLLEKRGTVPVSRHLLKPNCKSQVRSADTCSSCVAAAGTPVVPGRVGKTACAEGTHSHCCETGIALISNLTCKVGPIIWILNANFNALPASLCHSPVAPVHTNLPKEAP